LKETYRRIGMIVRERGTTNGNKGTILKQKKCDIQHAEGEIQERKENRATKPTEKSMYYGDQMEGKKLTGNTEQRPKSYKKKGGKRRRLFSRKGREDEWGDKNLVTTIKGAIGLRRSKIYQKKNGSVN